MKIPDSIAFNITPINGGIFSKKLPGYYLRSTASINVEDTPQEPDRPSVEQKLKEIASYLAEGDNPQLIIAIHGYANQESVANQRYHKIYQYAQTLDLSNTKSVFLGYRWPAENPVNDDPEPNSSSFFNKIQFAFQSLPTLVLGILINSLVLGLVAFFLLCVKLVLPLPIPVSFVLIGLGSFIASWLLIKLAEAQNFLPTIPNRLILVVLALSIGVFSFFSSINPKVTEFLLIIITVVFVFLIGIILGLIFLRLSTYPRDRYRATNYGVIDLVEFIRQIDLVMMKEGKSLKKNQVKLSFIAHSLGCEVVTQSIRIISDVFDPESIGTTQEDKQLSSKTTQDDKQPSSNLGNIFRLGRLILVAPDIPLESILSGRANFLRACLRRCEEAYIFCNEGDLALRLASTAANYFSFPAKTRYRGYKLGNITVKHFSDRCDSQNREVKQYGVVNLDQSKPHYNLEIRASNLEHRNLEELAESCFFRGMQVADFFTYFDCTDYVDFQGSPADPQLNTQKAEGIVSYALSKSALTLWWDYISLSFAYFLRFRRYINVHGGYFEGQYSQKLIYDLAFLGLTKFLENSYPIDSDNTTRLARLSQDCSHKKIQVVLSTTTFSNQ